MLEKDRIDTALAFLKEADEKGVQVILPDDSVVADAFAADASTQICSSSSIPEGWMGLDIGSSARQAFSNCIFIVKGNHLEWTHGGF